MSFLSVLYTIIIYPLVSIVDFSFVFAQRVFNVTGLSVIFVSVVITVLCLPLYAVAEKWQQIERDTQARLKCGVDRIKAVFKGDEQYMILTTYYRQNHYHPMMALRSSFGLLIQVPFFIAAYNYLSNLEFLNGASFLFLTDLGAPDGMFKIGSFSVNVLPIAMTLVNCVAGAIYAKGFSLREHLQLYGMAAIFLVLLYNSPSGLVLYWTMNNIFSLVKNVYYKVTCSKKLNILCALFSVALIFMMIYINIKKRGDDDARQMMSIALVVFIVLINLALIILPKVKQRFVQLLERSISLKNTNLLFFVNIVAISVFCGLFVPSNLIIASPQEFSYIDQYGSPNFFILNAFVQSLGFCVFWPSCLYLLFSNNVKRISAILFSCVLLCALINFFAFSGHYGNISSVLVFDDDIGHSKNQVLQNLAVLSLPIFLALVIFILRKTKIITTISLFLLLPISVLSFVNIQGISKEFKNLASYQSADDLSQLKTVEPIVSLSTKGKNVVVIMLDRAISVLMPYIFDDYPELKEKFSGFVFYPNTVSFNGYTRKGSPAIFGGYEASPLGLKEREGVPLEQKVNEALMLMPHLFSENGYKVTATDLPYAGGHWIPDMSIFDVYENVNGVITDGRYTDLWCAENNLALPVTSDVLKRNILWYSLLRISPYFMRTMIYNDGNWCALLKNVALRKTLNGYAVLDYLPRLCPVVDDDSNNVLIMDNNTTHEYFYLQAPEYRPVTSVTQYGSGKFAHEIYYSVNVGSLMRLAEWFDVLKQKGAYDNTRIILVSDHGPECNVVTNDNLPFYRDQFTALLMVKDFNVTGAIKTDDSFMCNADVPSLAFEGIVKNPVNPFTGNPVNSEAKKEPLHIIITDGRANDGYNFYIYDDEDYYVSENIFDVNNWKRVKQ